MTRAGRNLSKTRKHLLQQAKTELRAVFGRADGQAPEALRA